MSMDNKKNKLYYTIGEVSKIADLPQSVLRYWETEFDDIKPPRHKSGKRLYRQAEIDHILLIKKLLHEDRFTIEGARIALKKGADRNNKTNITVEEIKNGLKEIINLLDE